MRPAPPTTGWEGCGTPDLVGRPADGAEVVGLTTVLRVGPPLGTVRVVKRVVVTWVVEVVSCSGTSSELGPSGWDGDEGDGEPEGEATSVMGQTVVPTGMISVVTCPILPGQSVTVGAQLVMVYVVVA